MIRSIDVQKTFSHQTLFASVMRVDLEARVARQRILTQRRSPTPVNIPEESAYHVSFEYLWSHLSLHSACSSTCQAIILTTYSHFTYYPIPPLGEWDFVVVWFRVHYYYYSLPCSKQWLISHKVFKLSQWNFMGTCAMGVVARIMMYDIICHDVIELWQKMTEKMYKWMYELWSLSKRWSKFIHTMILGNVS